MERKAIASHPNEIFRLISRFAIGEIRSSGGGQTTCLQIEFEAIEKSRPLNARVEADELHKVENSFSYFDGFGQIFSALSSLKNKEQEKSFLITSFFH